MNSLLGTLRLGVVPGPFLHGPPAGACLSALGSWTWRGGASGLRALASSAPVSSKVVPCQLHVMQSTRVHPHRSTVVPQAPSTMYTTPPPAPRPARHPGEGEAPD